MEESDNPSVFLSDKYRVLSSFYHGVIAPLHLVRIQFIAKLRQQQPSGGNIGRCHGSYYDTHAGLPQRFSAIPLKTKPPCGPINQPHIGCVRPVDRGHAGIPRSRRPPQLGRPPRWEMRKIMGESNPPVLRFLPDRYRWPWKVGVMESADCNADMVWPQVGLPKHRRSARRAKMRPNLSSLLPVADIEFGRSFCANMFLLEEGNNAEHRTGSPLALATMAGAHGIGIGGNSDAQGTTRAMRSSCHSTTPSLIRCSETTEGGCQS